MDKVTGCCFFFAILFFPLVSSAAEQVHYAKGLKRDARPGISYANFFDHKFHYLNVSKVGSALVSTFIDCSAACINTVSCFSFNLAASPDIDGKLWCELLATDKYNASDKFHASQSFHHYSIYTPCSNVTCKNGGKCVALYERDEYKCNCSPGFEGKKCEKDVDECASGVHGCHSNAVCTNTAGSYTCACQSPYTGDGKTCQAPVSGCLGYSSLTDSDRKMTHETVSALCDSNITPGWYRFEGSAGTKMPTACVPKNRCNTHGTGWLSGGHPSVQDGEVSRTVCFHWSNCCSSQTSIKVKNCGAFYLYYLVKTAGCSYRYCGTD